MKTYTTYRRKGVNVVLVTLLLIATAIGTCLAQGEPQIEQSEGQPTENPAADKAVTNSDTYIIHLASNLNMSARAEAIEAINSSFAEYKPALALHGNRLYFSRALHPENTGGIRDKEDIWYSDIDKSNNKVLSAPKRLEGPLNNSGPNFVSGVSINGDTIMLGNTYDKRGRMRAGISYSINQGGVWSPPRKIHVKNEYNLSDRGNAYVSLSAGVIISAVERADTQGERDLYISFWANEQATEPINMGKVINTGRDESSPFLSADKKVLYFASKGHHGFGGYDIFMSRRLDDSWTNWSEPENLGPVVNGPQDEEFCSVTHCKQWAYFSKQVGEQNSDIYKVPMADLFGGSKAIFR